MISLTGFLEQNPDIDLVSFDFLKEENLDGLNFGDGNVRLKRLNGSGAGEKDDLQNGEFAGGKSALIEEIKAYQRLLRISSEVDAETAESLRDAGFDSAMKIASLSKEKFVGEAVPALGEEAAEVAERIHQAAENRKNQALHLWAAAHGVLSPYTQSMRVNSIQDETVDFFEQLPSYQEIFGSLDYCGCSHCKSIFGPAAYLVDLLRVTEKYIEEPNKSTASARKSLKDRRPDIYNLRLTCDNTNQTMPYTEIVIQLLERVVLSKSPGNEIYKQLALTNYPFYMPMHLELEKIRIYLNAVKLRLSDVFQLMQVDDGQTSAEYLRLSAEEQVLLTTEQTSEAHLKTCYGVGKLADLNTAETFCYQTGMTNTELRELVYQNLSEKETDIRLQRYFFINQGLSSPVAIEQEGDKRVIKNLNAGALDRIHRFIRLSMKLGWSFTELDWALHCVCGKDFKISKESLSKLARLKMIADKTGLSVSGVCGMVFDLKTYGQLRTVGDENENAVQNTCYDHVFNGKGMEPYRPKYSLNSAFTQDIWILAFDGDKQNEQYKTIMERVSSGLKISRSDALLLMRTVFTSSKAEITVENLSLLYGHKSMMEIMGLDVQEYVILLKLSNYRIGEDRLEFVLRFLELAEFFKESKFTVYELDYMINGVSSSYLDVFYRQEDVAPFLASLPVLVGKTISKIESERNEQLDKLKEQIASFFSSSIPELDAVWYLSGAPDLLEVFIQYGREEKDTPGEILTQFSRSLVLVKKLGFCASETESVKEYHEKYGISDLKKPDLQNIVRLFQWKSLGNRLTDIHRDLLTYIKAENDEQAALALHSVMNLEKDRLSELLGFFKQGNAVVRLSCMVSAIGVMKKLASDFDFLKELSALSQKNAKEHWNDYTKTSKNLAAAVKSRYENNDWDGVFSKLTLEEQNIRRRALVGVSITILSQEPSAKWVKHPRHLYEYLLIDVEMEADMQISYVKEALNAVQLYMSRCRQRLEPGVKDVTMPEVWWSWLSNYRVWEANRKIFLYPENYITPEQRNNKTKLFRELENTLKQGDINPDTVSEAYMKYLDAFSELAQLVYVDAYYCKINSSRKEDAPTLFLFARTQTQPYQYYYIVCEYDGTWSEWKKVDISVNSENISPVYAFNKLFIFWVETERQNKGAEPDDSNAAYLSSIKYSFYNFSGNWVQPQTLASDIVIFTKKDGKFPFSHEFFSDPELFNPKSPFWNRVYPLVVPESQYYSFGSEVNRAEKIVLFYGPMIPTEGGEVYRDPVAPSTEDAFSQMLYQCVINYNYSRERVIDGYLPICQPVVIDDSLEPTYLMNPTEFILLPTDLPASAESASPKLDRLSGNLYLVPSRDVIHDNYDQQQILKPDYPKKPTDILSRGMRDNSFTILTVKNHPSAWIFNGDKESFLLVDDEKNALPIDEGVLNSGTLFDEKAFVMKTPEITTGLAKLIFTRLTEKGFLLAYGIMRKNITFLELFRALKDEILADQPITADRRTAIAETVTNMLAGRPVFKKDAFVTKSCDIGTAASETIFNTLIAQGYLDASGRLFVDIDYYELSLDVAAMLKGQKMEKEKTAFVLDTLYQGCFMSLLGYFRKPGQAAVKQCKVKRLTTAAIHRLSRALFSGGIDRLLSLDMQQRPKEVILPFERFGFEARRVTPPAAADGAQVDFEGAYGLYYWELFFHGPLYVYSLLKANQQFEKAEDWIKYVFNPTVPERELNEASFLTSEIGTEASKQIYTILRNKKIIGPDGTFNENTDLSQYLKTILSGKQIVTVRNILLNHMLSAPLSRLWQFAPFRSHTLDTLKECLSNETQIAAYNSDPFDPHAIARLRLGAYEKNVVMQYIDNLVEWGDYLFSQYTWESLTSATMLYIYAYNLLGERPKNLGPAKEKEPVSFDGLYKKYGGAIPQFLIDAEHILGTGTPDIPFAAINELDTYFCVPENEVFLGVWDKVEDRLYKIRGGMNIEGIKQNLSLFEPAIDPAMLMKMAASGGDILDLLLHDNAVPSPYRFGYLLPKAKNLTADVVRLGEELLLALEKKDAEALAALHSVHERNLLSLTTFSKEKQIEEIEESLKALDASLKNAQNRKRHYTGLINENINSLEAVSLSLMSSALVPQAVAIGIRGVAIAGYLAPNVFGLANGGMQFGDAINAGSAISDGVAGMLSQTANIISVTSQYARRKEEWQLQLDSAVYDEEQLEKQKESAKARLAYAKRDLEIHEKGMEQAEEYNRFLKNKFTNEDLYQWMTGRISALYFQTYRLALSACLSAQTAYQGELASTESFIQFNYWDSLKKGLLAGEGLMFSMNQMEKAYTDKNTRLLEISKTVSLLHLDPQRFMEFKWGVGGKEKGVFMFELSEKLFDFDFPGHYQRKITAVSVTIPAVVGPYQNINATLVQNGSTVVLQNDMRAVRHVHNPSAYPECPAGSVQENWLSAQQIAVSTGVEDAGVFLLDFRDERYMPFEGSGAVSQWTFCMPPETNRINFESISDVILHIQYTAKDGGDTFAKEVKQFFRAEAPPYPYHIAKCIDLKQAFRTGWDEGMGHISPEKIQSFSFKATDKMLLPNLTDVTITEVAVLFDTPEGIRISDEENSFVCLKMSQRDWQDMDVPMQQSVSVQKNIPMKENVGRCRITGDIRLDELWSIDIYTENAPSVLLKDKRVDPEILKNIAVLITYEANTFKNN